MSEHTSLQGMYKARILAVDDEPAILLGLKRHLNARGYEVKTATGGVQALQEIEANPPDLVILDLMMPDKDGLEVTEEIRGRLHLTMPIIVLSARGEEQQKVEALDLGADDYLTKPFGLDELMARIRVALRHRKEIKGSGNSATGANIPATVLGDEHLTIDLSKHQVLRDGKEIKLTPKQYELLKYLALNRDKLVTHRQLLQAIWGPQYNAEISYLHVFINQLRQKLEANPAKPRFILTEPALGYRFRLPDSPLED